MVEVKYQDEQFLVKGVIDVGYAGKYENKDFQSLDDDAVIVIDFELDEILESIEDDGDDRDDFGESWAYLEEYTKKTDGDSIAKAIESYMNAQEKKFTQDNLVIKNQLTAWVLDILVNVGLEFWEDCPEIVIKDKMPELDGDEDELEFDPIYTEAVYSFEEEIAGLREERKLISIQEDLTIRFKELLPMFDIDKLFSGIVGTNLNLNGSNLAIQFDDSTENHVIFYAGYTEIRYDLTFGDLHNM